MAHAHSVVDNEGYRHKFSVCNTYCFSTATVVARTRPSVTLHYLACLVNNYTACCDFRTSNVITIACCITSVTN